MLDKEKNKYLEHMSNQSIAMIDKIIKYTQEYPMSVYPASGLEGTLREYFINLYNAVYRISIDLSNSFQISKCYKIEHVEAYFTVLYVPSIKSLSKKSRDKFVDLAETLEKNTFIRNVKDIINLEALL
jgi:hypothetical protein